MSILYFILTRTLSKEGGIGNNSHSRKTSVCTPLEYIDYMNQNSTFITINSKIQVALSQLPICGF